MGVCLCGVVISAGAWSVHLAVVQWAAHGIMTAAAASVVWGNERRVKTLEGEKNRKEESH